MQANWSLVINILLLIGVIIAISRMIKARRQNMNVVDYQPSLGAAANVNNTNYDDIIAVRKIDFDSMDEEPVLQPAIRATPQVAPAPIIRSFQEESNGILGNSEPVSSLMMFLLAKENRQLAGYELLQTVLAAGLRFGEGHLFHRHQSPNGQGPVLCSLASATQSGIFDLQNIGAFSVRGLCLFMHASGNPTIDAERFAIMLDTAKQLSEGLDTHLLDDQRRPLSDASIQRYYRMLNLGESCEVV